MPPALHFWSPPPPALLQLPPTEIHLWRADLTRVTGDIRSLSDDEHTRAARLRVPDKARQFAAARTLLRRILSRYLAIPAGKLTFVYGPHGKPQLEQGDYTFNLSHSGDAFLLAVGRDAPLGVDVEAIDPALDLMAVASRFFPEAHAHWLGLLPAARRRRAFFRLWTRREALAKGLGGGVGMALPGLVAGERTCTPPLSGWQVRSIWYGPMRVAALAAQGVVTQVRRYNG